MARAANTNIQITDDDTIQGITVDDTDIADTRILVYNSGTGNLEYEEQSSGGFDPAVSQIIYIDVNRDPSGESYTADGTVLKPYVTIADAHSAISDSATGKRYAFVLMPGDYAETVTMETYIDIVGVDRETCRITPTSGTAINFGATAESHIYNLTVQEDLGTASVTSIITSTGGKHIINNCTLALSLTNAVALKMLETSGSDISIINSRVNWVSSLAAPPPVTMSVFDIGASSTRFFVKNLEIYLDVAAALQTMRIFDIGSGSPITNIIQDVHVTGIKQSLGFFLYTDADCTGAVLQNCFAELQNNLIVISSNTTSDAAYNLAYSKFIGQVAQTNYLFNGTSTGTLDCCFVSVVGFDQLNNGAGTFNGIVSEDSIDLNVQGDITDGTDSVSVNDIQTHFDDGTKHNKLGFRQTTTSDPSNITVTVSMSTNTIYTLKGYISAKQITTMDLAVWEFEATAQSTGLFSGTKTITQTGLNDSGGASTPANWDLDITVNTTDLRISCTGEDSTTINWDCVYTVLENAD